MADRKVLVIDDAPVVTDTLVKIFVLAAFEARGVYSAETALKLIESGEWVPDLAIIDVHMPGMNGIDLAIMLKAQYPNIKLTLFSGHDLTASLLEDALREGHSFDIVAKPIHPTELISRASSLLG